MVFSSVAFLFYFFPISLLLYYAAPRQWKNAALFLISLVFYAWGEPIYILLLLFSTIVDYLNGRLMERYDQQEKLRRLILIGSLIVNIGVLGFFKYAGFLVLTMNQSFGTNLPLMELPLPIGISFYTFQTMSYMIDVYRRKVAAQRRFIDFGAFVSMFPQLVAGPIVRYDDIAQQLQHRRITLEMFAEGIRRFIIGLGKKVLLANNIGLVWDMTQSDMSHLTTFGAWMGIAAFAFQIYFDFSGYSDMAIGLGKMLGFSFPENFRYPYIAASASEFWRRWHITLGFWFRDYVYFPLGGSRVGRGKLLLNLFIVWFLTGLWHGASWNFVLWGLYFGLLIGLEKLWLEPVLRRMWKPLRHLYLLAAVLFGWTLFAIEDLPSLVHYLRVMIGLGGEGWINEANVYVLSNNRMLFFMLMVGSTPLAARLANYWMRSTRHQTLYAIIELLTLALILYGATAYIIDDTYNPFLYFRF